MKTFSLKDNEDLFSMKDIAWEMTKLKAPGVVKRCGACSEMRSMRTAKESERTLERLRPYFLHFKSFENALSS